MTLDEKKRQLYQNQKELLDQFLKTHAITQAQYDKSLGDLTEKMDSLMQKYFGLKASIQRCKE